MSLQNHLVIGEVTLAPAAEWSPKIVNWAMFRVATGLGYLQVAGATKELSEGNAVSIPSGATVAFLASRLGKMRLQCFSVHLEFLSGLLTLLERHALDAALRHPTLGLRFLSHDHPLSLEFAQVCEQSRLQGSLTERFQLLHFFTDLFCEELAPHRLKPMQTMGAPERFEKLIREMPDSELAKHSLPGLARKCGCSERHFSRLFKKCFGTSIRSKQTELRLEKAKQLLEESNTKVINVALDCGYQHLGLFNFMFKKRFGMTPTEWRRDVAGKRHRIISARGRRASMTPLCNGVTKAAEQLPGEHNWAPTFGKKSISSLIQNAAT